MAEGKIALYSMRDGTNAYLFLGLGTDLFRCFVFAVHTSDTAAESLEAGPIESRNFIVINLLSILQFLGDDPAAASAGESFHQLALDGIDVCVCGNGRGGIDMVDSQES